MQTANNMKEYHNDIEEALDDGFLRVALDNFAIAYRTNRANIFKGLDEATLIKDIAEAKDLALGQMDKLLEQFSIEASKRGIHVHVAATAGEANELIRRIAKDSGCREVIKSKSMTTEEILLNHSLEKDCNVVETDLGEWIIQNRNEGPSHMVMPAIHLSRNQVSDLFKNMTGEDASGDITRLVRIARRSLRKNFAEADMGVSGANFAIADTGTIGLCTNEGNGRLVTTVPRVHVALIGLDKLVPNLRDAFKIIRILPKNATAQNITSYVSWVTGANVQQVGKGKAKEYHIIFLDNGRRALMKDEKCRSVLRCVRCGACANVCPVYRLVGGHKMGHIYIGAVGLILTYFLHGRDKARNLVQNCINCGACARVCAADIDLPAIIQEIRARIVEEEGSPIESSLVAKVMKSRKLFHSLLKFAKYAQRPVTGGTQYIRHLPEILIKGQGFRALPALAKESFREQWNTIRPSSEGKVKVAIFAGCAQDFIYPEQLKAAMNVFVAKGCGVDFPKEQNCCGLPLSMMGERSAAESVALQNVNAFDAAQYDYIITMCASCASHIKHTYPKLLAGHGNSRAKTDKFVSRIIDFSSFTRDVLGVKAEDLTKDGEKIGYHAPCHLCRGLEVTEQPRSLIQDSGEYIQAAEEEDCCGFGGSYSVKFPEISSQVLARKVANYRESGATTVVTDCPGCVLQLRGGMMKNNANIKVQHIAELVARKLKR